MSVFEIKLAAPLVPVVVNVIVPCLLLNVLQSAEDNAPLLVAEAVGTFNVITGVVELLATEDVISVPDVPIVRAATDVTVPTLHVLFALRSYDVPLIVSVVVADAPPRPFNVYVGTLRVLLINVAEPLEPVVVNVMVFCLLLNVFQSVLLKYPSVEILD